MPATDYGLSIGPGDRLPGIENGRKVAGNRKLREACTEFEGMLLSIILKEGMKSSALDDTTEAGNEIMRDFSIEQAARQMGEADTFGIGRLMYEQITGDSE